MKKKLNILVTLILALSLLIGTTAFANDLKDTSGNIKNFSKEQLDKRAKQVLGLLQEIDDNQVKISSIKEDLKVSTDEEKIDFLKKQYNKASKNVDKLERKLENIGVQKQKLDKEIIGI